MAFRKFDKSKDKNLFSEAASFETTRITVGVFSYNDGEQKMQVSRENRDMNTGEWQFSKLGRMTYEEVEKVIPMMKKGFEKMPKPAPDPELEGTEEEENEPEE